MKNLKTLISKSFIWYALLILLQFAYIFAFMAFFAVDMPYINVAVRVVALFFVLHILNAKMNPSYKIAWIIPILAIPIFGISLYLLLRRHGLSRKNIRLMANSDTAMREILKQNQALLVKVTDASTLKQASKLFNTAHAPIQSAENVVYFPSGEAYFERLKTELNKAERFIFLEFFIIGKGSLWDEILAILEYKACHGVDVRLIFDDIGSQPSAPLHLVKKLAKIGIQAYKFNPFKPFINVQMNNRTHRKMVIIDGRVAFSGGVNIADEYVNRIQPFGKWKDAGIMFGGKGVDTFTLAFLQSWSLHSEVKDFAAYVSSEKPKMTASENTSPDVIIPFTDIPADNDNVSEDMYLQMIYGAKESVYFFTPYLVIDNELRTAMLTAKKSGVDIRVVVPHVPDKKTVFELTKLFYTELVENDIKVYEYTPGFIHSKVAIADGKRAYVGTCNLDYRSLFLHFECGVFVDSKTVCAEIASDFDKTFAESHLVEKSELKTGKLRAFWRGVLRMFAPLM